MQDFDGPLGFVDGSHLDEAIALGAVGVPVVDDLDGIDGAGALEEVFKVEFSGVVGEIADIQARSLDGLWFGAGRPVSGFGPALGAGITPALLSARSLGNAAGSGPFDRLVRVVKANGLEEFLPPRQRNWLGLTARAGSRCPAASLLPPAAVAGPRVA